MNPLQARLALAAIARSQVGTKEIGGNNRGPQIVEYQKATWLEPGAWPWCAAFVCWCIREWLKNPSVNGTLSLSDPEAWRPKTAGAWDMANWARKHGRPIFGETAEVRAGDLILFDFSHIGLVVEAAPVGVDRIVTVEGNTNGAGDRDSTAGDGVWEKERSRHLAKQFIRLV